MPGLPASLCCFLQQDNRPTYSAFSMLMDIDCSAAFQPVPGSSRVVSLLLLAIAFASSSAPESWREHPEQTVLASQAFALAGIICRLQGCKLVCIMRVTYV